MLYLYSNDLLLRPVGTDLEAAKALARECRDTDWAAQENPGNPTYFIRDEEGSELFVAGPATALRRE